MCLTRCVLSDLLAGLALQGAREGQHCGRRVGCQTRGLLRVASRITRHVLANIVCLYNASLHDDLAGKLCCALQRDWLRRRLRCGRPSIAAAWPASNSARLSQELQVAAHTCRGTQLSARWSCDLWCFLLGGVKGGFENRSLVRAPFYRRRCWLLSGRS